METKPVTFRKRTEEIELPDLPELFIEKAQRLLPYLNGPDNLIAKLEAVYRLMDEMAPFIASFASCAKGCSHCCSYDVQITTFEAEYIFLKTEVPHGRKSEITTGHNTPCPFLSSLGECSIYSVRPVVCRTYHALGDPAQCADQEAEQIQYGSQGNNFGNQIYAVLVRWVHFQTSEAGGQLLDIRDFFPHPRGQVQQFLATKRTTPM